MATWRRITGVAGLAAGAVAAGAGAVVAAERIAIGRTQMLRRTAAPENLGQLRGQPLTVITDDGVPLHVEIDEPPAAETRASRAAPPQPLTIIFCHGYTLNQDCWHFQRAALGEHRLVFWDQRDHGRSGRSAAGAASIDRLGADLDLIIKAVAPGDMPVVLAGHSMGGMTIMALARQHPGLFGTKVTGRGPDVHRGQRPVRGQPVDARPDQAGAHPGPSGGAPRRRHRLPGHAGGRQPPGGRRPVLPQHPLHRLR